jgi:hypothetical protein
LSNRAAFFPRTPADLLHNSPQHMIWSAIASFLLALQGSALLGVAFKADETAIRRATAASLAIVDFYAVFAVWYVLR